MTLWWIGNAVLLAVVLPVVVYLLRGVLNAATFAAREYAEALAGGDPQFAGYSALLIESLYNLGAVLLRLGRLEEGEDASRRARDLSEQLVGGGDAAALRVVRRLELAIEASSLGGVETLVSLPFNTSHVRLSPAERLAAGIPPGFVRVSIGIEDPDDLIADFEQALDG